MSLEFGGIPVMEDQVVNNEEFIVTSNTDEEDNGNNGNEDPLVTACLANDGSNLVI